MKRILELLDKRRYSSLGETCLSMNTTLENYLDDFGLFVFLFKKIPNGITEKYINTVNAESWFLENYGSFIEKKYFTKYCFNHQNDASTTHRIYVLKTNVIVHFVFGNADTVTYSFEGELNGMIKEIYEGVKSFKVNSATEGRIFLLVHQGHGFWIKGMKLKPPKLSISDNYNDDFSEFDKTIIKRLSESNGKGLVLLYGKPGSGKTSYIKYLSLKLSKKMIFLTTYVARQISSPELINLLIDNPNSILVIEDAEDIILERGVNSFSAVSTLLNLTDGLLSDVLSVHVICTFNTNVSKIDQALLRKGRLIASYEFNKLNIEKAQKLSAKLNFKNEITEPMFLNEIYNQDEETYTIDNDSRPVGFSLVN